MLSMGCAQSATSPFHSGPPKLDASASLIPQIVGVETVEDQARTAVVASATDFILPSSQAAVAWERGLMFFRQYTSRFDTVVSAAGSAGLSKLELSNRRAADDVYVYTLKKRETGNGVRFIIECGPRDSRASPALAQMNGRNLARFVREGTLELSLLSR